MLIPIAGSRARNRTTIPIPPSQLVMLRQNRIPLLQASISLRLVAPVVVNPLIISKNAAL